MARPLPPTILLFTPYPTFATISGSVYGNDATHLDTLVQIDQVQPEKSVVTFQPGFAATNLKITGLGLLADVTYRARMRYENSTGFSSFSKPFTALVLSDLAFPALDVPTEPISAAAQPLPLEPSFAVEPTRIRDLLEWKTETGDLVRRLPRTRERETTIIVWENLSTSDKDTLLAFLNARITAVESFGTTDVIHGARSFFTRQGQIETRQMGPTGGVGVWSVQIDADEVFAERYFTVEVSKVGGPDPIR
ncbi:MAG: hypothetical protein V3U03_17550 [Myxococcota bacterium]